MKPWNTMPTCTMPCMCTLLPSARPGSALPRRNGLPRNSTSPWSRLSRPFMVRMRVVLPEPDGPMIDTTSPQRMSRSMPLSTSNSP
ncbi:hypothetical protein D3C76_1192600 [compost metagenome]